MDISTLGCPVEYLNKDELIHELEVRNFPGNTDAKRDDLRKQLRQLLKLTRRGSIIVKQVPAVDRAAELRVATTKVEELELQVSEAPLTKSGPRLVARCSYWLERLNDSEDATVWYRGLASLLSTVQTSLDGYSLPEEDSVDDIDHHVAVQLQFCRACGAGVECAPTAILLVSLIHALYGHIGPEPDYFGEKGDKHVEEKFSKSEKSLLFYNRPQPAPSMPDEEESSEAPVYDFIVVGGGTAGSVVASRLSEVRRWKVLLIEAGPEQPKLSLIPGLTKEFQGSAVDWKFSMRPKKGFCRNRGERGCEIVQGRTLGGTSSINDMAYMRGSPADYDEWALLGNDGWSYSHVLPYFKYSEGNYDKDIYIHSFYHSRQGPLDVGRYQYIGDNIDILMTALDELGYNYTDINGRKQLGFTRVQTTTYLGERVSTNTAFIEPIRKVRPNIEIVTQALVTKILFEYDDDGIKAVGVEFTKNGKNLNAFVSKEVVLCAGAINSPKLLMESGIGPKEYLEYLNIPALHDLSVGSNFHDHLAVCLPIIKLTKTVETKTFIEKLNDITRYYKKSKGPLSANIQVVAYFETSMSDILKTPDIEFRFKGHETNLYFDTMDVCVSLLTPKSRGQVVLNATDPLGKPLIYPNYLKDPSDELKLLEGIQEIIKIFDTDVFKWAEIEFGAKQILNNECRNYDKVSDEFWSCIIKHFSEPLHNYVGTCKMGPAADPDAVVDNSLKVHGINHLRVVDASIIPKITRGSTMAPVIMIAEKASDLIKSSWS